MNVSLSKELRKKYGIRSFRISRGDMVEITGGTRKGEGGKVVFVDTRRRTVIIDGISISKADGKQTEFPVSHSRLKIIRLDGTRKDRMEKLRIKTEARHLKFEAPEPIQPEKPESVEAQEEKPAESSDQTHEHKMETETVVNEPSDNETAPGEAVKESDGEENDRQN